ncbi:hypothetical protein ACOIWI_000516 [Vibrio vulnificus]|nr:hypothetical protein [Vibrio vulnificus]EJP4175463.1 hypothetical protein [Vibrio vulnificus]ELX4197055.1 hypothetical protein [Vibrio vulnificus]
MEDNVGIKLFIKEHFADELKAAFEKEKDNALRLVEKELEQRIQDETEQFERNKKVLLEEREKIRQEKKHTVRKEKEMEALIDAIHKLGVKFKEGTEIQRKLIAADSVCVFTELVKSIYCETERAKVVKEKIQEAIRSLSENPIKVELSDQIIDLQRVELREELTNIELVFVDKLAIDEAIVHTSSLTVKISTKRKLKVIKDHIQGLLDEI